MDEADKVPVPPTHMFMEQQYHFCSDMIKDRFLVGYYGTSVLDTNVHFMIVCHRGDTLYHDRWPSDHLLTAQEDSTLTDSMKVRTIRKQMQALISGDLEIADDSLRRPQDGQPAFSYQLPRGTGRLLVFDRDAGKITEM